MPELLGKEEPDLPEFVVPDALQFQYRYNILPEGLLPRFIVGSRILNKGLPRWRSGVVLEWDDNRAIVKADVQERRVTIAVTGPLAGRRRLLTVIRHDLEHIHRSIIKLQATEHVPVPGHLGLVVEYETLRVMETEGETDLKLVHNGKVVKVSIGDLLDGVEEKNVQAQRTDAQTRNDASRSCGVQLLTQRRGAPRSAGNASQAAPAFRTYQHLARP